MNLRITALFAALCFASGPALAQSQPIDLRPIAAAVARQQLSELASVLEQYYPYLKTQPQRARLNARVKQLEASIHGDIPTWKEWLLQEQLVRPFNDPHLAIYPEIKEDRTLAVELKWVSNGLLISPASWSHSALFPKNSVVIRIGSRTPDQLLPRLEALYPGTVGWVASRYGAIDLREAFLLRWLHLLNKDSQVPFVIRTPRGKIRHVAIALAPSPDWKTLLIPEEHAWFGWTLDKKHNVGWFRLGSMKLNGAYEKAVTDFFAAVRQAGITRVAVDIRHNGGGSSLAEAPFMQYLGVTRIQDYSSPTYFDPAHLAKEFHEMDQALAKLGISKAGARATPVPPQPQPDQLFHGKFFVVTGPRSFSSAMEFAADVKFNHLGTIVGLPCGEVVTGPGDVKFFAHPKSGVPFQVPTDVYTWPGLPQNAVVQPDVNIPVTIKDVQEGIDPVHRWFDTHTAGRKAA